MPAPVHAYTPAELEVIRGRLQQRLDVLSGELATDRAKIDAEGADVQGVNRRDDDAGRSAQADVDDAELDRDLEEAAAVRGALARVAEGRYGWCVDCGEAIGRERLAVQPAAARCAPCQAATERSGAR